LKYRVRLRNFDAIGQMVERRVGISILPNDLPSVAARPSASGS
jgi:hypothetical protein